MQPMIRNDESGHGDPGTRAEQEGVALLKAAQQQGDPNLIGKALALLEESLTHSGIPDHIRARRLSDLGAARFTGFQHGRSSQVLDAAISAREASLTLTSATSTVRAQRLSALAGCLRARFELLGDPDDINRAITTAREAVRSAGDRPSVAAGARAGLANALRVRYERLGGDTDLDESITQGRRAVSDSEYRSESWAGRLTNLSISLRDRYLQRGDVADLDEAISASHAAVTTPTANRLHRALRLTNYALALRSRHICNSQGGGLAGVGQPGAATNLSDIDAAIDALREAVDLSADLNSGFRMSKLAAALLTRFEATHDYDDLVSAVAWARKAVGSADPADGAGHSRLNDLVYALTKAAAVDKNVAIANEAIRRGATLLALTAVGSANRALYLTNVGLAHRARYELTGDTASMRAAIELWQEAAHTRTSVTAERFNAATHWALCANWIEPGSALALDGFGQVINLIPTLAWRGIGRPSRERFLREVTGIGGQAAAAALTGHRPDLALSFEEGSRGVLWSQLLENRADLTKLSKRFPELAQRLKHARMALEGHP